MLQVIDKECCVGCGACAAACSQKCIQLLYDEQGFLYPSVDSGKCVDCQRCQKVCPALKATRNKKNDLNALAFGCLYLDEYIRLKSSSGGIFSALVEEFFHEYPDGVVYGAAFDENMVVKHIAIRSVVELDKLRGSKYVQSELNSTYAEIKQILEEGGHVYFSGTPCQVAGLKTFLGRDDEKLFTQAILCHGVPSPKLWEKYIASIQEEKESKIKNVRFRDKTNGWEKFRLAIDFLDGTTLNPKINNWFMNAFFNNISLRPCCYNCAFKYPNYYADITIGDFWNVKEFCPELFNDSGVSLAITSSEKGYNAFKKIQNKLEWREIGMERAIKSQKTIVRQQERHKNREEFFAKINSTEPLTLTNQLTKVPLLTRIRRALAKKYREFLFKLRKNK